MQFASSPVSGDVKLTDSLKPTHPRLLADDARWNWLRERRKVDPLLEAFLQRTEIEARAVLNASTVTYDKVGYRLLAVSRIVLQRVLLLSFCYRLTGDTELARRAEREMLTVAAFHDWNPSHFLDTGEMTAALALGYDWLFDELPSDSRAKIRTAIVELGVKPGIERDWSEHTNNWNAVCLAGILMGALAVAENEPELAEQTLQMVKRDNPVGLIPYAPMGVHPEGPWYWSYGAIFQVLLVAALESAVGTDWGLAASPGFMESAAAYTQTIAPSGRTYNFFDGDEAIIYEPVLFWFAGRPGQPNLLDLQKKYVKFYSETGTDLGESIRLSPLTALWWPEGDTGEFAPLPVHWLGVSENPLAIFRDNWDDPRCMYLALKGGKATLSHGHMDAGSFIFESDGVRWAKDLGRQDYHSLESIGVKMWDRAQDGGRWTVFRYNNFSHNTLTLDGQLHRADGHAEITRFFDEEDGAGAILDMADVLGDGAISARRGFVFRPSQHVYIVDELTGLRPGAVVRWAMATAAEITLRGTTAELTQEGETLTVSLTAPEGTVFEILSADPSADGFNAPNPGILLLVANVTAPESGAVRIGVRLQPRSVNAEAEPLLDVPLTQWP